MKMIRRPDAFWKTEQWDFMKLALQVVWRFVWLEWDWNPCDPFTTIFKPINVFLTLPFLSTVPPALYINCIAYICKYKLHGSHRCKCENLGLGFFKCELVVSLLCYTQFDFVGTFLAWISTLHYIYIYFLLFWQ